MPTCPNINSPEWKALVNNPNIGTFQAYKDFFESGTIRSEQEILDKLEQREMTPINRGISEPNTQELYEEYGMKFELSLNIDSIKQDRAAEFADRLSNALGIDYEMITASEAQEITKDAQNPWSGQSAFFFGDKVYFINNRMTTDLVFHEFAHPLVRSLAKQNRKLFENLFNQVQQSKEGQDIINSVLEKYTELDPNSDLFKEEVIVQALEKSYKDKSANIKSSSPFTKAIKNLLYAIKQAIRQVFGKSLPVSKLSAETTLNELANMLEQGEKFSLEKQLITNEDIVAYNKEMINTLTKELQSVEKQDIQASINSFYDKLNIQIEMLKKNKNLDELARIILYTTGNENIFDMKRDLQAYQSKVVRETEKLQDEIAEYRTRVKALANSMYTLEVVLSKMKNHIKDLEKNAETREAMHKAHYYDKIINYWDGFIQEIEKTLSDANVPNDAKIVSLVNSIRRSIRTSKDGINKMMEEGAIDGLWQQLAPMNKDIGERYERIIAELKRKKAPREKINRIFKEYHGMTEEQYNRFKELSNKKAKDGLSVKEDQELATLQGLSKSGLSISKEKIRGLIKGEIGDANYFNSYLEGYLYNTDPIIGGLALYTKNALNEVMIVTQSKMNTFAEELRPLLEAAGYNPTNKGKLGEDVGFLDTVARFNPETGVMEEKKVWTFLNPFKNYRYDEDRLERNLADAYDNWIINNTDAAKKEYLDAKAELREFKTTYMNQEYTSDFYARKERLQKTAVGREVLAYLEDFFQRLREVTEPNNTEIDKLDSYDIVQALWREYRQAHSMYDLNGKLKSNKPDPVTGISPLALAKEMRQYREEGRDFYEWKVRTNAFETAYRDYQQELLAEGVGENHPDYKARMDLWKQRNTRVVIKQEWYEEKRRILAEIKQILDKLNLPENERAKIDQGIVWEKILELTGLYRDQDGQIQGQELSEGSIQEVKALQEELERIKNTSVGNNGLTKIENERLSDLFNIRKERDFTAEEFKEYKKYISKKNIARGKLSGLDRSNLIRLYKQLGELTSRSATEYYVDIMNNWLSKLNTNPLYLETESRTIETHNADVILQDYLINPLLAENEEFKKWFEANHIRKEKWNAEEGEMQEVWERIYAWNVTEPSDPSMYETYTIRDSVGNVIDTMNGMPTMNYYYRAVKNKYKTSKVQGVTIDNRGRWLPKSREEMAKSDVADKYKYINEEYYELQQNKPELFALLEKLKEHHLKNQEGLGRYSKLYLDMPRFQKDNLEGLQSTSLNDAKKKGYTGLTWLAKRIRGFFKREADDADQGFNENLNFNLVRVDMFDNEITNIPIAGLYNLDSDDVSTDITYTMMRYMFSAERQKQLINISPFVRSVQKTVKDNPIIDTKKIDKDNFLNRNIIKYIPKGDKVREKAIDNFISREFEGQNKAGVAADSVFLNNFSNLLFKRASFAFFALNIPSALKNSLGMKFQHMIEAAGGEYVDIPSLGKGKMWAYRVMAEYSGKMLYQKRGALTLDHQIVEIFDPIQDRFAEKFGERLSRTVASDAAGLSWLYSIRKWVEAQAAMELFAGMAYKQKINRRVNGEVQEISYLDAWELNNDKQITLKSGIDVRYGKKPTLHKLKAGDTLQSLSEKYNVPLEELEDILGKQNFQEKILEAESYEADRQQELDDITPLTEDSDLLEREKYQNAVDFINKKYDQKVEDTLTIKIDNTLFKLFKNRQQQVQNDMGGAYAKFDQPEMQRYLWFRFVSYMRKYFTTMALKRWGFSGRLFNPRARLNPGLGEAQMGYYIETGRTLINIMRTGGKELAYLTSSEKAALMRFGTEVVMLWLTMMAFGLFGWDPEDEDRIAKLRAKTGALPFPFSETDPKRPFNLKGYLDVHALHLLMQVRAENEQFNLLTGGVQQYASLTDIKSVAFGPTMDSYTQIYNDLMNIMTGSSKAQYTRRIGPYEWQQKGGSKLLAHLATTVGLTGSTVDPVKAVQGFQAFQAKVKR